MIGASVPTMAQSNKQKTKKTRKSKKGTRKKDYATPTEGNLANPKDYLFKKVNAQRARERRKRERQRSRRRRR